eukprot:SM000229S07500  [mRNA]  locus=s229:16092:19539:- [translate_table: standard]
MEEDELENVDIAEQAARAAAYKAAKQKSGTHEDKFENDISGTHHAILPKYDDVVPEEGIVLDVSGGLDAENRQRLEEVRRRLFGAAAGMREESLASAVLSTSGDYMTAEEVEALKFKKSGKKKKKKLRKKDVLDIDALEAEAVASGLGKEDLGKRGEVDVRRHQEQEERKAQEEQDRRAAYEGAKARAEEASRALQDEVISGPSDNEGDVVFEEDEELQRSLERARLAALKKQAEQAEGPQRLISNLEVLRGRVAEDLQAAANADTEGGLVFTDTGEFCRSLQLDEAITRRERPKEHLEDEDKDHMMADVDGEAPGEREGAAAAAAAAVAAGGGGGWTEVGQEAPKGADSGSIEGDEAGQDFSKGGRAEQENDEDEPLKEVRVGKGLAGALSLLKDRGVLANSVEWGGRNMDKKKSKLVGILDKVALGDEGPRQKEIRIDRLDEFGRQMTPKESFRRLSHAFHGKPPGKMKQEKRIRQHEEELKMKTMSAGDTPLMSMEKMRENQAQNAVPYIVISGQIKPGQTSDPKSGFATVEKSSVGSLTPMLGDQKVEAFLGIQKRAASKAMGPPAAKKPKPS